MTSSDPPGHPADFVADLLARLSGPTLRRQVDQRIETALAGFASPPDPPATHLQRLELLASFAAHLSWHGLPCRRRLTRDQAVAEAIALLEQHPGAGAYGGYRGCLIDMAMHGQEGLELTLSRIFQAILTRERNLYLRGILQTRLGGLGDGQRREVAAVLLQRVAGRLPPILQTFSLGWWAENLPTLVKVLVDAEDAGRELLGGPTFPAP